jgi:O-antigen/teichoic acid export membrane protein
MSKKFSINLLILLALNLLIKPVYLFGVEVGVQNAVGAENYGLYYAMFNFTFLFNVLLDLGINNYQKIKVAQHATSGLENMPTLLPLKLVMSGVYMLVTILTALFIGFEAEYWFFIGWIMVNQILSTYLLLLRANLSGLHLFVRDSFLSIADRLILVLGVGYLLLFGNDHFQIETFVLFQSASYVAAILLALALLPSGSRFFKWNFSFSEAVAMVKKTWPFALLILLMTAYHKLDGIMIERLSDNGLLEAGIYAQAFRILDAGNNFAFLYAGLLLPMFARLFTEDFQQIKSLLDQTARFLIIPAGIAFILILFTGDWFMKLLYIEHALEASVSLKWLMGSFVWMAVSYVYGTLITASTKMRTLNIIAFGTVILNVVLNAIYIPEMGAEGAAIASFVSLGFMAFSQIYACQKRYPELSLNWLNKAVLVWCAGLAIGALTMILSLDPLIQFFSIGGVSALAFVLIAFDIEQLKQTLNTKSGQ